MRVIGGKYRGKKLISPKTDAIRPTADIVRQAMFTKIQFDIAGSSFLDLFGGTGANAIEALSRGAKNVVVVDNNEDSIKIIKANSQGLEIAPNIIFGDYKATLKKLQGSSFDFIFIDPPYAHDRAYTSALKIIKELELLTQNGIVICEHPFGARIEQNEFEVFDIKKYGTVELVYYKKID